MLKLVTQSRGILKNRWWGMRGTVWQRAVCCTYSLTRVTQKQLQAKLDDGDLQVWFQGLSKLIHCKPMQKGVVVNLLFLPRCVLPPLPSACSLRQPHLSVQLGAGLAECAAVHCSTAGGLQDCTAQHQGSAQRLLWGWQHLLKMLG